MQSVEEGCGNLPEDFSILLLVWRQGYKLSVIGHSSSKMTSMKAKISVIIFDAGDILVHMRPDSHLEEWKKINQILIRNNMSSDKDFRKLYDEVRVLGSRSQSILLDSIKPSEANDIEFSIVKLIEDYEIQKWWLNPDPYSEETIRKLVDMGFDIGILTDSALPSLKIREVLKSLCSYIKVIVSSRDVGVEKPDRLMYSTILSNFNVEAKRVLFIAHDEDEIQGALENSILCENLERIGGLKNLINLIKQKYVLYE